MSSLKTISQSWLSAGLMVCMVAVVMIFLSPKPSYETSAVLVNIYMTIWLTLIFAVPATLLNWLYDKRGYERSQREWMQVPHSLLSKVLYVLTGSVALWCLLIAAIYLAVLVGGGLYSLGQAAWST